jgi:hypothetical protein
MHMYAYTSHVHSGTVALTTWLHAYVMLPVLRRAYSSRSRHGQLQRSTTQQVCSSVTTYIIQVSSVHATMCSIDSVRSTHCVLCATSVFCSCVRMQQLVLTTCATTCLHNDSQRVAFIHCVCTLYCTYTNACHTCFCSL